MSNQRAVPYYCPYCADEDLRPYQSDPAESASDGPGPKSAPGSWHCRACTRVFTVKLQGMVIHDE